MTTTRLVLAGPDVRCSSRYPAAGLRSTGQRPFPPSSRLRRLAADRRPATTVHNGQFCASATVQPAAAASIQIGRDHVRHVNQKATTQRDGRAASLRRTGRRRASAGNAVGDRWFCYTVGIGLRKRPVPEDAVTTRQTLLARLARDADIFELFTELAPLHPRDNTFPGEVFLMSRGRAGLVRGQPGRPAAFGGTTRAFLPERTFRSRQKTKFQHTVLAAAAHHGGTEPDLLDEVAWCRPMTSGSTRCSRRSPTLAPPPAGRACRCARHARTWPSALATPCLSRSKIGSLS